VIRWRTYDTDVRLPSLYFSSVRILLAYVCRRRTSSTAVRIIRYVRIFLAYAFYFTAVRIICHVRIYDVCHSATYVFFCRTCATDVRIYARTSLREIQIRDYAVEIEESGLRSRDGVGTTRDYAVEIRIRDYAEHSGSDEEDPLGPIRP